MSPEEPNVIYNCCVCCKFLAKNWHIRFYQVSDRDSCLVQMVTRLRGSAGAGEAGGRARKQRERMMMRPDSIRAAPSRLMARRVRPVIFCNCYNCFSAECTEDAH